MRVESFLRYRLPETVITLLTINASTFERYQEITPSSVNTQEKTENTFLPSTVAGIHIILFLLIIANKGGMLCTHFIPSKIPLDKLKNIL